MSLWHRAERVPPLPAQVRAGLGLRRGERLLAHGGRPDGGWAIATTAAVVLVDPVEGPTPGPGTPSLRRLWHEVAEAGWDPDAEAVYIRWADGGAGTTVQLIPPHGRFPEVLRERVMSTFVLSERIPVQGRRGVTVAVRRHAVNGSLFTQTVPDSGVNPSHEPVAEQVAALTRDLCEQVGLRP
ncbi:hypothetical protein ACPPVT_14470 [Angustibacter sp. McL0619]|uniref:hypothetical protein n=1 Tax=Angustibacter sp. McL0619 TaxID=3415676 RepID=UPI003CF86D52